MSHLWEAGWGVEIRVPGEQLRPAPLKTIQVKRCLSPCDHGVLVSSSLDVRSQGTEDPSAYHAFAGLRSASCGSPLDRRPPLAFSYEWQTRAGYLRSSH